MTRRSLTFSGTSLDVEHRNLDNMKRVVVNNKLYIKCKTCGDKCLIARKTKESYVCEADVEKKMNYFFKNHKPCWFKLEEK